MQKVTILIAIMLIVILLLSGCWDRIEIEKNAFILGIGLDKGDDDMLNVTYQIALPDAMKGGGEGGEGDGGETSTLNINIYGKTLKETEQILRANIDRYPNYEHLKVIVFGEELSREGLAEHIDFLFRNPQSRRLTKVVVCEGEAKQIFEIQPKTTKSTAQYINSLLEDNGRYSIQIASFVDLTTLENKFLQNDDFILAKLKIKDDNIDAQGAGIFKSDRLVGWLDSRDVAAVKWLKDEIEQGTLDLSPLDGHPYITIQIIYNSSKIKPIFKDHGFIFDVSIQLEYDLSEVSKLDYIVLDEKTIGEIEQTVINDVKELCEQTFYTIRDIYGADPFAFSNKISNYYPLFWAENGDVWDDYFVRSQIAVEVDAHLRRVGLVK